jgi:predicted ribosomally synthesized peptide with nif11-like leader
MAGLKEFKEKMASDEAFATQVKGLKSFDDIIGFAIENGYEFSDEDIEKLTDVSEDDLSVAAGGVSNYRSVAALAAPRYL